MSAVFPLWMRDTTTLARDMIEAGLRSTITCIDPRKLDRSFAGRAFDAEFLKALPDGVDPCGENGEFHTFASSGPMFTAPIHVEVGDVVEREGFVFADLLEVA
jgi:diphthamide synthase (EF-2-diphthine--ammonia ligase)